MVSKELEKRVFDFQKLIHNIIGQQRAREDSLLTGNLGLAIYHYYSSSLNPAANDSISAAIIMEDIIERVEESRSSLMTYNYSNGLAGLGVGIQFLQDRDVIDFGLHENFRVIDEFIFENALEQIENGYVEYLHGGGGALYYFQSRLPDRDIIHYQDQLIQSIIKQTAKDPMGVRIPRGQFIWNTNDDFDLSLAHGLCGVLHILLSVLEAGQVNNCELIRSYLHRATLFVSELKREIIKDYGQISFLPSYMDKNSNSEQISNIRAWPNSRLAWCYGDLGWVLFFYRYGIYTQNDYWIKLADEIGIFTTTRRTMEETGSTTAHICHGHAGLVHAYKTLYRISGRKEYKSTSEFWLDETLKQLKIELGNGLYRDKYRETNFLEGLAGISLVLNAYINPADSAWDKFLLFS